MQLSFTLRVSSSVKQVHLVGSWDNYKEHLPLARDRSSSSKTWAGTFRFPSDLVQPGQRYWYYYLLDGYHISHNPSVESTTEPTTGRELNILDVPASRSSKGSSSSSSRPSRHSSSTHKQSSSSSHRKRQSLTVDIPKGRPLSYSQIQAPKPVSPKSPRHILDADLDEVTNRFASTGIYDYYDQYGEDVVVPEFGGALGSPISTGSSLSYRSDSSSPSSGSSGLSGYSTPTSDCSGCTCERYGITRKGERVRIDCGGARCGYDDSCSSSDGEYRSSSGGSRRNAVLVRG